MPGFKIIILLSCVLFIFTTSGAVAKNDLEIFGLPASAANSQEKSHFGGDFNLVLEAFSAPDSAAQGEDISDSVTLSVRNDGPDPLLDKCVS